MSLKMNYYCENVLVKSNCFDDNQMIHRPVIGESIIIFVDKKTYQSKSIQDTQRGVYSYQVSKVREDLVK